MSGSILILAEWIGIVAVILILSISPVLRNRRPVKFTQPRQEGVGALSLVILVVVFTVVFARIVPGFHSFISFQQWEIDLARLTFPGELTLSDLVTQAGFFAICVLPVIYFVRRKKQPWLSLGLKQQMFIGGLQVGLALLLVTIFLRGKLSPLIYGDKNINQLYLLVACLVAAFGEEIIFRGYLQPRLENWLGNLRGYILSAVLSSMWVILPLLGISWAALVALFVYRLLLSLLLGWVLKRSGSILPGWLYHTIHMWLFWI